MVMALIYTSYKGKKDMIMGLGFLPSLHDTIELSDGRNYKVVHIHHKIVNGSHKITLFVNLAIGEELTSAEKEERARLSLQWLDESRRNQDTQVHDQ